jgi:hypothetical protein
LVSAYKCILALASVGMTAATTTCHISDSKSAMNFLHSVTITATTFAINKGITTDVCVVPVAVTHTAAVAYTEHATQKTTSSAVPVLTATDSSAVFTASTIVTSYAAIVDVVAPLSNAATVAIVAMMYEKSVI